MFTLYLQAFLHVLTQFSKKPYVFMILLHSFCQLTQTITVYQIKITHFDADLFVFFTVSS